MKKLRDDNDYQMSLRTYQKQLLQKGQGVYTTFPDQMSKNSVFF